MSAVREEFLRTSKLPHIWCPGCGNGIITAALVRAIDKAGLEQKDVTIVSGIGCSSRAPGYLNFNTLHTTHGRALAFATGLKLAQPGLNVFVITGDGDATAIGGNHFIHAARRNIDLNVIIVNNHIYGMTGGQHSPLTPEGKKATTAPTGTLERSFDILDLARASGATFCGRATVAQARLIEKLIVQGKENKGFSVVEARSTCPVAYGRRNKLGGPVEMTKYLKDKSVRVEKINRGEEVEEDSIPIGVIHHDPQPEFTESYYQQIANAQAKSNS